ncbi:MAG: sulfatase [Thermoanaerobaculia bacterium]
MLSSCGGRVGGPVIFYVVDTLRPDRMSTYGAERETSPAATRLASEGVLFRNAYTLSSWTRPAIATLLTSRLPSDVGALNRFGRLSEKVPYLPEIFRKHGWPTGAAVGNGNVDDERLGFRRGFDHFDAVWGEGGDGKPFAEEVVARALAFVASQRSPKFFLYVHVIDPHSPYKIPSRFRDSFGGSPVGAQRDALLLEYDRTIRTSDAAFERLVASLEARGWWQSALAVYLSDHGEEFFEHGALYHGATLYEEQTRVPLVVKYPGNVERGSVRSDPVTLADVMPTVAEMMGWKAERAWIGESFWKRRFSPNREIYGTEDLDKVRMYSLRRGPEKVIVSLYPSFDRRYFRLDRDRGETDGAPMPCGAVLPPASDLVSRVESWRSRDLAHFPQTRFVKRPGENVRIDLAVQLKGIPKPFLTAADLCRLGSVTDGDSLLLREPVSRAGRLDLRISASDRGVLPPYRLSVTDEQGRPIALGVGRGVTVFSEPGDFMAGPTADQAMLRRLRALGYLGGN